MKKNKMMRAASVLLILVLLTTCTISGTFAKYTSTATVNDTARVAYWGFGKNNDVEFDLFLASYDKEETDKTVVSVSGDVIAPGTSGSADFAFKYSNNTNELSSAITAPEVDYTFDVSVTASCDELIKNNRNIVWKLDNTEYATDDTSTGWEKLVAAVDALGAYPDGQTKYNAGQLPSGFDTDDVHTISWEWKFEDTANANSYTVDGVNMNQDQYDTYMGNQADLDDVSITITITATQVD